MSARVRLPVILLAAWIGGVACAWAATVPAAQTPAEEPSEAEQGPGVSLTIYNDNFALIKQRRLVDMSQGTGTLKFLDVAATIIPESVQFAALKPTAARVIEQNYEFDLLSADKLLDKYIDRPISVVGRDGSLTEGTLLSADNQQLVLSTRGGIELIPRQNQVKDIRFSSLPEGLLLRPTLVWKVAAQQGGEHLVRIAYGATGINWRVDYRAVASADEKTLDLSGWVTITNRTGTTFADAGLKLMAGDVHLVEGVDRRSVQQAVTKTRGTSKSEPGFEEKSFAEYHLYTLGRRTTLADAQTKQIELINVEQVPVSKEYLYRSQFGNRVAVVLSFKNSNETCPGLGVALPKGPFRVYGREAGGQVQFVGQDSIDHTPKDETVRIRTGYAFDLVAERTQTGNSNRSGENWNQQDWRIVLRNHKSQPVDVLVEESLNGNRNWQIVQSSQEYEKKDFRTIQFHLAVPANGQTELTYTVEYTW